MKRSLISSLVTGLISVALGLGTSSFAQAEFNLYGMSNQTVPKDGDLVLPSDYRSWPIFLSNVQRPDLKQIRDIYINQMKLQLDALNLQMGQAHGPEFFAANLARINQREGAVLLLDEPERGADIFGPLRGAVRRLHGEVVALRPMHAVGGNRAADMPALADIGVARGTVVVDSHPVRADFAHEWVFDEDRLDG